MASPFWSWGHPGSPGLPAGRELGLQILPGVWRTVSLSSQGWGPGRVCGVPCQLFPALNPSFPALGAACVSVSPPTPPGCRRMWGERAEGGPSGQGRKQAAEPACVSPALTQGPGDMRGWVAIPAFPAPPRKAPLLRSLRSAGALLMSPTPPKPRSPLGTLPHPSPA